MSLLEVISLLQLIVLLAILILSLWLMVCWHGDAPVSWFTQINDNLIDLDLKRKIYELQNKLNTANVWLAWIAQGDKERERLRARCYCFWHKHGECPHCPKDKTGEDSFIETGETRPSDFCNCHPTWRNRL